MTAWQAAAIALAIGFLIGAQRGRDGGPGVRTFALAGLAGAIAALVHPLVFAAAVLGGGAVLAAGYLRPGTDAPSEFPASSRIALLLTVLLGGLTVTMPALAAVAGVVTAAIMLSRDGLSATIREKITDLELKDALKFAVVAVVALPLMPHASVGPYGVVDPRRLWTFVVAVTALGWLGYVLVRLAGPERGLPAEPEPAGRSAPRSSLAAMLPLPAAGLAGGFVSGAATTGAMARASREPVLFRPAMAAALLASVATLIQLVLVAAVADTDVAALLLPGAAAGVLVLVAEAAWLLLRKPRSSSIVRAFGRSLRVALNRTDDDADSAGAGGSPPPRQRPAPAAEPVRQSVTERVADEPVVGATVISVDFNTPSVVNGDLATHTILGNGRPPLMTSTVDAETAEMPVVDSPTMELPRVPRRSHRAIVGRRPFDLVPALLLTAILAFFLVIATLASHAFGGAGAIVAVAVSGLADAYAGALTAGNLATQHAMAQQTAALAALSALAVNTVVKLIVAHAAGGRRASMTLAGLLVLPVVAVVVVAALTLSA